MSLLVGLGRFVSLGKKASGDVTLDTISAGVFPFGLPTFSLPPFEVTQPTRKLVKW